MSYDYPSIQLDTTPHHVTVRKGNFNPQPNSIHNEFIVAWN